jgi:MFS superfamily sulfate permease-like transporter
LIRGFISGVAIVIFTEQLITELGLEDIAKTAGYAHSSAWEKAKFVYHHIYDAHRLTFLISLTAFLTLVIAKSPLSPYASNARYLKESIGQRRYKKNWVTLIPDILGVVAFSACSPPRPPSQG